MAVQIDFRVVNNQMGNIKDNYDDVVNCFSKIDNSYLNRVNSIWSSDAAEKYYNSVVETFNTCINNLNKLLAAGAFVDIHNASKHISDAEKGMSIRDISGNKIALLNKNWTGSNASFKVPSTKAELEEFTKTNFTNNANKIVDKLNSIKSSLMTIRDDGLSSYIAGDYVEKINKLIESLKESIEQNNETNTKNAAVMDANAHNYVME